MRGLFPVFGEPFFPVLGNHPVIILYFIDYFHHMPSPPQFVFYVVVNLSKEIFCLFLLLTLLGKILDDTSRLKLCVLRVLFDQHGAGCGVGATTVKIRKGENSRVGRPSTVKFFSTSMVAHIPQK